MSNIPKYYLSYVAPVPGHDRVPKLHTSSQLDSSAVACRPYVQLDVQNSAYLGHLIHDPRKSGAVHPVLRTQHPISRILDLAARSPDDFDDLIELAGMAVKAVSYYDRRWVRPYDPASCALRAALSEIARRAFEDRGYLERFHAGCLVEDRDDASRGLLRILNELADVAANRPHSQEFFLLEALASFDLMPAQAEYRHVMFALSYGINTARPDWREKTTLLTYICPIPARPDQPDSLVPRTVQLKMEARKGLIMELEFQDAARMDEIESLFHLVDRFAKRSLELATGDVAAWIAFLKKGSTYLHLLPTRNMGVEPQAVMIYAMVMKASRQQLLQITHDLGHVALNDPDSFRYLYYLWCACNQLPMDEEFNAECSRLDEDMFKRFDSSRMAELVEADPSTFTALDRFANLSGHSSALEAFFQLDAKRMLASWIEKGLPPDAFYSNLLPLMSFRGNDSAKTMVLELEGVDPDSGKVEQLRSSNRDRGSKNRSDR